MSKLESVKFKTRQMSASIISHFLFSSLCSVSLDFVFTHRAPHHVCVYIVTSQDGTKERKDEEGNLNGKTFCHSASFLSTIVR